MLVIRESTIKDAEEIGTINAAVWEQAYPGVISDHLLETIDVEERIKWQKETYADSGKKSFVAIMDDKIVGYCNVGPLKLAKDMPWASNSTFNKDPAEYGEIYAMYVLKAYTRLGCGRALMDEARKFLKGVGYKHFQVYMLQSNVPAINFYKSQGGVETYIRDWTYNGETYKQIGMVFFL